VSGENFAARDHRALGVELQQPLRHLAQGGPDRFLHALPGGTPRRSSLAALASAPRVLGDQVEPLHRQVEVAALRVLEEEEVGLAVADGHGPEPQVPADP